LSFSACRFAPENVMMWARIGASMADIFLSYAREDAGRAKILATALESRGWSVWWDRHIPAGREFAVHIAQQLASPLHRGPVVDNIAVIEVRS
jgi:hypothetical protein